MINRKAFFESVRKSFGKLKQTQVDGFNAILDQWEKEGYTDLRWLAYMLATAWHETAKTMQAIEEDGKGRKHPYGKIDPKTRRAYYGRGLVQLTWNYNYQKMGKILDLPLYERPELALDLKTSVLIMFEGMLTRKSFKGDFTRYSLENFFNKTTDDPKNARRIINGLDCWQKIQGHHEKFLDALKFSTAE